MADSHVVMLAPEPAPNATVASLPMYDFAALRDAHAQLWAAIVFELKTAGVSAPAHLTPADDVHELWHDPALFFSQSCGWPLVTELDGRVSTIGTFAYDIASGGDGYYRSVIVATVPASLAALTDSVAAVNNFSSLSGWICLRAALGGDEHSRQIVLTGSHVASLVALRSGRAMVAAIDAVTYALLARDQPALLDGLVVVGSGPRVPCLPIIGPRTWDRERVGVVRAALGAAVMRPELAAVRARLLIQRFVPLDAADYAPLLGLVPAVA